MAIDTYDGKALSVTFDTHKCIHARNCVLSLPNVFKANVPGPWIDPDASDAAELTATIKNCPSGALAFAPKDGSPGEAAAEVNTLRVLENGPYAMRAEITLRGAPAGTRAVLCRCGDSKHKPYCDGTHKAAAFAATGEPSAKPDLKPLAVRGGVLNVAPQKDGPLKVEGNLEIVSGTGRRTDLTSVVFLCRCGHSKNKPYCDGSHKPAGFKAD